MSARLAAVAVAGILAYCSATAQAGSRPAGERAGNYLIVTASTYNNSTPLNQFVAAKGAQGFNVRVHSVASGTGRDAIRAYIQSLWGTPNAPDYVLLVGDTDGSTSTATTIPHFTGGGSKHAPTDLPYACMDAGDDWYPNLAVGRFSVRSTTTLQDVVNKSLTVENGNFSDPDYVKRIALLASNDMDSGAEETHNWVIENYLEPAEYEDVKIYARLGGDTEDVTNAINDGCIMAVYFGHSSSSGWWAPSFSQSNVQSLSNSGLYGLVFGFSCNTAAYDTTECYGETWQRVSNRGAAAYLSASTYIYYGGSEWESSRRLEKYFFQSFFVDDIWEVGPAWQAGLFRLLADPDYGAGDVTRNMFEMFTLLGDPSLLLPQPNGFSLDATPTSHDLCTPPQTSAQYTIEVGKVGEFDEVVTLSATEYPAGASVAFSVNGLPPPFTTVMTVSGLTGAMAGSYDINVRGTSTTLQRSIVLGLNVSSGLPGSVLLLSPPNGADGVPLLPIFTWAEAEGAVSYELEVAADAAFNSIVYSAAVSGTSHQTETPLPTLAEMFWHVRAINACGVGAYSPTFDFTTVDRLMPAFYNMLNGETGSYTYYDDTYDGDGNNDQALAPLSNGLGDLTDGVIATSNWNSTPLPYVGWKSIEPTITFHFGEVVNVRTLTLHLDDSNGNGGVYPPTDVEIIMGGQTLDFEVVDPPAGTPFAVTFSNLGLRGDTMSVQLLDDYFTTNRYMMLSEVELYGAPVTGACCLSGVCEILTDDACAAQGGEYQGDDTTCEPNPCPGTDPGCLFISEVVNGTESGGHPIWLEITNAGLTDFNFVEGGLIVQTDGSSDVAVDVDLSGVTIPAGDSYVINSTAGGGEGAFNTVYGFDADFYTPVPLGDGNDCYILTDAADGSHQVDIYGEFGVDGTGLPWEYTDGYAYRLPADNAGNHGDFDADEWFFGGPGSLVGPNPTQLLLDLTTPGAHAYTEPCVCGSQRRGDANCDEAINGLDIDAFVTAMLDPAAWQAAYECDLLCVCDMNRDLEVDLADVEAFIVALLDE